MNSCNLINLVKTLLSASKEYPGPMYNNIILEDTDKISIREWTHIVTKLDRTRSI